MLEVDLAHLATFDNQLVDILIAKPADIMALVSDEFEAEIGMRL